MQNTHYGTGIQSDCFDQIPGHNGGSVRGYQAIFVPLAALSSPGYSPVGGQPAVYLYIAALEANCPLLPRGG